MHTLHLLELAIHDPVRLAPFVAGLSAAATAVFLLAPVVALNRRRLRIKRVAGSERNLRRAALLARGKLRDPVISLRYAAPSRLYSDIVSRFKLDRLLQNPKTRALVHQAGYRGPAAAIKWMAMRLLVALGLAGVVPLYGSLVLDLHKPLLAVLVPAVAGFVGWYVPILFLKNRLQKRRTEIQRNWPDASDLLLICVEAGMSIEAAFRKVAEEIAVQSLVLSEELSLTTAELAYLQDRQSAFRRLAARVDVEDVRSICTSLIQAEKYGTPLGQAIRVLTKESRALRMAAAEKKAASLPPKLTVPMIIFFLPVLFAVIMTPAIIQMMR